MFAKLFRRPAHKPRSTREMIRVLRAAAQFSDDAAQRIEYDQAADALDRVLTAAERHSDAPTRDAFAYALGRAELDLGDKLTEVIEVVKDTHVTVQGVHTAQIEQGAAVVALRDEFQSFGENISGRMTGLEGRMDTAEAERQSLSDKVDRLEEEVHGVGLALRLARMLELTEDALIRIDAEQKIIWLSSGAPGLFGYTAQELIGQPLDILIPERFHAAHRQHIRDFGRGLVSSRRMAERQVVAGRHKDGSEIIVSAAIAREQIGGSITFAVLLRPVEKAVTAEVALGHQ
jgi:PAS domain S-box-containing protein